MIDQIIKTILKHEGGYVNHPSDKGGPTKYGITQRTLTDYLCRQAEIDDVKNMEKSTAIDIYKDIYYRTPKIDVLPDSLQPLITDMAVHHGPRRAIKILQEELQHDGFNVGLMDGIIGKKTIKCTAQGLQKFELDFIDFVIERRLIFCKNIIQRDPTQKVFWNGWMNRIESFRP